MGKINIAVVGYGNIGKGVIKAIKRNSDTRLSVIFTRRPEEVKKQVQQKIPVLHIEQAICALQIREIPVDVAILCCGSKEDLPVQGPKFAFRYNIVDSFDTHADIPRYFRKVDLNAKKGGNVAIISAGWDPGIFSFERVLADAFLPESKSYTFWGRGISQGHSNAARKVNGVKDARQYTVPIEGAINRVRRGETPEFTKKQMHKRWVYVVAEPGADLERIRQDIVTMPHYFDEYDTQVVFISQEEMKRDHSKYPHGGFVLVSGITGEGNIEIIEYRCQLTSNPEFTAGILVACARAAFRLKQEGRTGAFTMLDIPASYLSRHSGKILRRKFM